MFKFLASAALATAAVVLPTAARAEVGGNNLVQALDRAGVEVTVGNCQEHGITGTYGFFHNGDNWIHICSDTADTQRQQWETLRHEAVHAAQFCKNPSMTSTLTTPEYLKKNSRESDAEFIVRAYDKADWAIELEAFTLMRLSNNQVADIVNYACN